MNAEQDFRWDGLAEREVASEVRRAIQGWAARAGLPANLTAELALASYEAMANVIEHAYLGRESGPMTVRISRDEDNLRVVVSDRGRWRSPVRRGSGGRGLTLMEGLAKELTITRTATGTRIEMRWPMPVTQPDVTLSVVQEVEQGTEDAEDRLRGVAAVTDPALAKLNTEDMYRELLIRVRDLLDVDTATVLLRDTASETLLATASVGIEEEVRQGVRIPFGHGFAGTVAARQAPILVEHVDATTVLNPLLWEAGLHTLLGVPVVAGGRVMGVLHVGSREQRSFTDQDIHLLELAAERFGLAARAAVSHADHAAANALQRSLLPSRLPEVPGYDFAARYVPSAVSGVGGDWYDVFPLPGNRIGVVIGDVSGHGLASAVVMGRLRSALRAYALDNDGPDIVLDKLDRKAHHFEAGVMATVAYGIIDLDDHRLRFCLAGHLPPAIAVPGRPNAFADAAADPPIGFDLHGRHRRCHTIDLPADSLVCFYTDGLIERRGRPIDEGMDALLRILQPSQAESACTTLMARFVGTETLTDDVAVLIVHRADA